MSGDLVTERVAVLLASPREHDGVRVVTLSDIARVHAKAFRTVQRAFLRHRAKGHLIEGVDYFAAPGDNLSHGGRGQRGRFAPAVFLLTQTGYVLLTKAFDDAPSWAIMRELVSFYFGARSLVAELREQVAMLGAGMEQARRALAQASKMAKRAPSHAAAILGLRAHDSTPSPRQTRPAGRTMHDWRELPELREAALAAEAENPDQILIPGVSYALLTDRGGSDLAGLVGRIVAEAVAASVPGAVEKVLAARAAGGVT